MALLLAVVRGRCGKDSSRSLSHLLMSFLLYLSGVTPSASVSAPGDTEYWIDQPLLYDFKAELAGTGDRSKCDIEV